MPKPAVTDPHGAAARTDPGAAADPAIAIAVGHDLEAIEAEWRRFERDADGTAFQTFDWLAAYARHVAPLTRLRPLIVLGRAADGTTLFILPLALVPGTIRRLTWLGGELCDYNGPLLARDFARQVSPACFVALWREILGRLAAAPATRFDLVDLTKMPPQIGAQPNPMLALATARNPSNAYVTDLAGSWDAFYDAKRSSATRRRDRSKLRRLGECGEVRFVTPKDADEIGRTLATLMAQKARSFARMGVDNIFERPGWRAFFTAIATDPATRALVHVSRLDIGDCWSAINLGLVHRDTYYHVLASHDDGAPARFGPGVAHLRELLRYAIERGLKHFDFTIGDERYKREWAERVVPLHDHVAAASLRGHAAAAMLDGQRRLKRAIKQNERTWTLVSRLRAALGAARRPGAARRSPASEPVTQSPPLAPK
ncbi:MAG: GNAT family N-acetyltransferase [Hyphomicrobiales bacterium]|nr:GNAT family N-acetyltransferase [Hyphomicrobiales bacterium]